MNKFGLEPDEPETVGPNLAQRLAAFPPVPPRPRLDLAAVDAAAAPHGFISREAGGLNASSSPSRRRRIGVAEPTRHLAIRLTLRQYDAFVAYADEHELTYQDAIVKLLDDVKGR